MANEVIARLCEMENESELIGKTDAYEKLRPYAEMSEVLEYMRENHALPIKLEELAEIVHHSPSQLNACLKRA